MKGKEKTEYVVRRKVLNMALDEWQKLKVLYPSGEFTTTPEIFLDKIGLPGGLSSYFNQDERLFFDAIYDLHHRRRVGKPGEEDE